MNREKEIYKVTLLGSLVNVVLMLFKFVAGIFGHSAAMMADAIHSATVGSQVDPIATLLGKDVGPSSPAEGFAPESTPCRASLHTL